MKTKLRKFVVEYTLAYDHVVQVGVVARNAGEACTKAKSAFDQGTIWDDTPNMPLLYDDFDEQDDNTLDFRVAAIAVEFPEPAACVTYAKRRVAAMRAARLLVAAYERGKDRGGEVEWSDLDAAYRAALEAVPEAPATQPEPAVAAAA